MDVSICGQLSSMEAISHNAVGRKGEGLTAAVGKRTKLFVRQFSAPLFKFTLCSALPRSLQESDEKQPESREETKGERTENQCNNAGSLLMMFSNQCSQPSFSSSFFNAKEKYATAHRESLPFSLFQSHVSVVRNRYAAQKIRTPQMGATHSSVTPAALALARCTTRVRAGLAR